MYELPLLLPRDLPYPRFYTQNLSSQDRGGAQKTDLAPIRIDQQRQILQVDTLL